jgi:hypothetical protein
MSALFIACLGWSATAVFVGSYFFCPALSFAWRADVRRVAVDCLRLTDQCVAGDSRKCSGLCRSRMDDLTQNPCLPGR